MGIREYFKQHPEGEELKLQNMRIKEKPKSELRFDVTKEISDEEWKQWILDFKRRKDTRDILLSDVGRVLNLGRSLALVFPDRTSELDLQPIDLRRALSYLNGHKERSNWSLYAFFTERIKTLFPDQIDKIELGDDFIDGFKKESDQAFKDGKFINFVYYAMIFKILLPNRFAELELENKWQILKEDLSKHKSSIGRREIDFEDYMALTACLKVLFPEKEKELEIDDAFWKKAREYMNDKTRHDKMYNFVDLKILAAEEIKFTDHGLELVMEKADLKVEKFKRPERRSF